MTDKSNLDIAAEHIVKAQEEMALAAQFIPDGRERAIAKTHFDTALLWFAEAMNLAKRKQEHLQEIKQKPKML